MGLITLASDTFQRANESPLSNGGSWTSPINGGAQVNLVSNNAQSTSTANESRAFWTALTWPNNQFSEITIGAGFVSTTGEDPSVRFTTSNAVNTGYRFIVSPTTWSIFRNLNGVGTTIATGSLVFAVGDVVRLDVIGTVLNGYKNGLFVGTATDSNITSGRAGFGLSDTAVAANAKVSFWRGGTFGGSDGLMMMGAGT